MVFRIENRRIFGSEGAEAGQCQESHDFRDLADLSDEFPYAYREASWLVLAYMTPAAFAGTFTATGGRLRNPDQLRRPPVAPPASLRQSQPKTLASNG